MKKLNVAAFTKRIEVQLERLGKERDRIDSMIDDLETYRGDADEAIDALEQARDALSRYI